MKIKLLLILLLVPLSLSLFFILSPLKKISLLLPNGQEIQAEIANSPETHAKGLMYRKALDENAGMFFIFQKKENLSFWMKNTLIPLDIIFLDENLKIINIAKAEPCQNDPCPLYESDEPAIYVLEINQSLEEKYTGKKIKIKR